MCDLFGLSCNSKDRATRSLPLFSEYSDKNLDGWGIGYYKGNEAVIAKHVGRADASEKFGQAVEKARSNVILAHLRSVSSGGVCDRNCHPFKYRYLNRNWIFAHNGTIHKIVDEDYPSKLDSDIDSARAFSFIMDKVGEYLGGGMIRGVYWAVVKATKELLERYGGTLNYLLSDGDLLYAFSHYPQKQMYFLRREKDYGGALLICTQELTDEKWVKIPENRVLVVSRGEVVVLSDPIRI